MASMLMEAYDYIRFRLKQQAALADLPVKAYNARPLQGEKWIVQQKQGGRDNSAVGGYRNFSEFLILVRVVMQTDKLGDIRAEAEAIDAAFVDANGVSVAREEQTPSGLAFVHIVTRDEEWDQPESVGTVEYRSAGGLYRIRLQPVSA